MLHTDLSEKTESSKLNKSLERVILTTRPFLDIIYEDQLDFIKYKIKYKNALDYISNITTPIKSFLSFLNTYVRVFHTLYNHPYPNKSKICYKLEEDCYDFSGKSYPRKSKICYRSEEDYYDFGDKKVFDIKSIMEVYLNSHAKDIELELFKSYFKVHDYCCRNKDLFKQNTIIKDIEILEIHFTQIFGQYLEKSSKTNALQSNNGLLCTDYKEDKRNNLNIKHI